MKIKRLYLRNFRVHADTTWEPGPGVNVISGPSGHGKSSLVGALEYALTGRTLWTPAGQHTDVLVRGGTNGALVQVDFNEHMVERPIPSPAGVRELQESIGRWTGVSLEMLEACLRPMRYLEMTTDSELVAKSKELVWRLLGDVTDADLLERLNNRPDTPKLGDYYFGRLCKGPLDGMPREKHYKHIKEVLLKNAQQTVRTLQERVEQAGPYVPPYDAEKHKETQAAYEAVQLKLAVCRGDEASVQAWENAVATHKRDQEQRVQWQEEKAQAEQELATLKALLEENPVASIGEARGDLADELEKVREELADLLKAPPKAKPEFCPEGRCALKEAAKEEAKRTELSRILHQKECVLQDRLLSVSMKYKEIEAIVVQKRNTEITIEAMERNLAAIPVPDPGPKPEASTPDPDLLEQVQALGRQVAEFQAAKMLADEHARWDAQMQDAREKLEKAQQAYAYLDALKDELGPKGVRATAMEDRVAEFLAEVNAILKPFSPTLELDPVTWFWQARVRGRTVPVSAMSTSQRLRLNLGIQIALAKRSALNVVVMDTAESVDHATLKECLTTLEQHGLQAFVVLVRDTMQAQSWTPGCQEWWVNKGQISKIGQEVAV